MTSLLALFVGALAVAAALRLFVTSNPATMAEALRRAAPVALLAFGVVFLAGGRVATGGPMVAVALAWIGVQRRNAQTRSRPHVSIVRSAALEMQLDLETGEMSGVVLAGPQTGKPLSRFGKEELLALRRDLASDRDSLELLEAYLDRRFAGWRDDEDAATLDGERGAPGSGPVSEQEAYQILGLEAGASAADIRKAHRRLMQRVHPDVGGSAFLAQRINEAKDILLGRHG